MIIVLPRESQDVSAAPLDLSLVHNNSNGGPQDGGMFMIITNFMIITIINSFFTPIYTVGDNYNYKDRS